MLQDRGDHCDVVGREDEARQVCQPAHLDGHVRDLVLEDFKVNAQSRQIDLKFINKP